MTFVLEIVHKFQRLCRLSHALFCLLTRDQFKNRHVILRGRIVGIKQTWTVSAADETSCAPCYRPCDRSASLRYSATGRIFVLRSSDVFDRDCHLSESYARCTCRFIFDSRVVSLKRDARREEKKEKDEARQVGREIALPRNCMLDVYVYRRGIRCFATLLLDLRRYCSQRAAMELSPAITERYPLPSANLSLFRRIMERQLFGLI